MTDTVNYLLVTARFGHTDSSKMTDTVNYLFVTACFSPYRQHLNDPYRQHLNMTLHAALTAYRNVTLAH